MKAKRFTAVLVMALLSVTVIVAKDLRIVVFKVPQMYCENCERKVKDNIRFGKLDATQEEIERAARIANAHSFIRRLPDGYDTMVTADGANLSQGQRQLLAISRAVAADPKILLLDEITADLDAETEHCVLAALRSAAGGRTVVSISHRLYEEEGSRRVEIG